MYPDGRIPQDILTGWSGGEHVAFTRIVQLELIQAVGHRVRFLICRIMVIVSEIHSQGYDLVMTHLPERHWMYGDRSVWACFQGVDM